MQKTYVIDEKTWTIEYNPYSHEVQDVKVHLTKDEYRSLKRKLATPGVNHQNGSSVEILKNGFAKARGEAALESAQHIKPYEGCLSSISEIKAELLEIREILLSDDPNKNDIVKEKLKGLDVAQKRGEFEQWLRSSNHTLSAREKQELQGKFLNFRSKIANMNLNLFASHLTNRLPTETEINTAISDIDVFLDDKLLSPHDPSKTLTTFLNELETTSTKHLEELSRSINGGYDDPITKINEIEKITLAYHRELSGLKDKLSKIIEADLTLSPEQRSLILKDIDALTSTLDKNNAKLLEQLKKLKDLKSNLTHEQVDLLLSAQDRGDIYSLGHFVGDQTSAICKSTIDITSVLQDRYLLDIYYKKNEVTAAFIEASSELRIRHETHYGARYVNTQTEAEEEEELPDEEDFSVLPFMTGTTASDLDKMICLVSGESLSQRSLSMPSTSWGGLFTYGLKRASIFIGLYTLAPIAEIALSAVHLALALPATVLRVLVSPLVGLGLNSYNFLNKWTDNLSAIHHAISPVRALKRIWNEQYKRLDYAGNPVQSTHQEMLADFNEIKEIALL